MSTFYNTYYSMFKFFMFSKERVLALLILLSIFRVTQLLKFLIPIKVFFMIHDSGTFTSEVIVFLSILGLALILEASYQLLSQSLRYNIAQAYLANNGSHAKITILNFTKASSELTVSTLAVATSICVIAYFSIFSALIFMVIFFVGLKVLLGKFKIHQYENIFQRVSDIREVLISVYSVVSMTITTIIYFYDWWNEANFENFIVGFLLLRFMVNTSVSALREYLTVSRHLKNEALHGVKQ